MANPNLQGMLEVWWKRCQRGPSTYWNRPAATSLGPLSIPPAKRRHRTPRNRTGPRAQNQPLAQHHPPTPPLGRHPGVRRPRARPQEHQPGRCTWRRKCLTPSAWRSDQLTWSTRTDPPGGPSPRGRSSIGVGTCRPSVLVRCRQVDGIVACESLLCAWLPRAFVVVAHRADVCDDYDTEHSANPQEQRAIRGTISHRNDTHPHRQTADQLRELS
jgi:hypothetical protein